MLLLFFGSPSKSQVITPLTIELNGHTDTLYFSKSTADEIKSKYGNIEGYKVKGKFKKGHWKKVKIGSFYFEYDSIGIVFGFHCQGKANGTGYDYLLEQVIIDSTSKACTGRGICIGVNESDMIEKVGEAPKGKIDGYDASYYHALGMIILYDSRNRIIRIQIDPQ